MAKIVVESKFASEEDENFFFKVSERGLEAVEEYCPVYISLNEIPEFITWLQTEYDRQKSENN